MKFEHPLLRLLVMDWRFSCLLVVLLATVLSAVALPLKIWKRTPPGFTPEVIISALDWIQSRALARSARKAEKTRDFDQAVLAWASALANDPCDQRIAANYIRALLRSKKRPDLQHALQVALWLQRISSAPESSQVLISAADRNRDWNLIIMMRHLLNSAAMTPETQSSILKALFHGGKYREAKEFLKCLPKTDYQLAARDLYADALNCILDPGGTAVDCVRLRENLRPGSQNIEAHEIYLITCAEKGDAVEFQNTLNALKQLTDQTLVSDALHVRLLLRLGRLREARQAAARFRAPHSAQEAFDIADALVAVGDRDGATAFLAGYRSEFDESSRHLALYARLLVQQRARKELTTFRRELQERPSSPASELLICGISCFLEDSPAMRATLNSALSRFSPDSSCADFCYFAAEVLLAVGQPEIACQVLLRIEPQHLNAPEFYSKLFAAAEASRDAELMRRVAERSYQLAPADPRAAANYAAMLVMCDEQSPRAVALSAYCLKVEPSSIPAKVNYAAALINSESFGAADLILRDIDEAPLSNAARNQLRFIKLKRAFKLHDKDEIVRLASSIDKSALYSVQLGWLTANKI